MTVNSCARALSSAFLLLTASPVLAADICQRGTTDLGGRVVPTIYGEPFEVSMTWPLDALAPPELIARPESLDIENMFDDLLARTDKPDCRSDNLSGAIGCVTELMEGDSGGVAPDQTAPSAAASNGSIVDVAEIVDGPNLAREVAGRLKMRPVYLLTNPPRMSLLPIGGDFRADRDKLTPEVAERVQADWQSYLTQLRSASVELTAEMTDQLSRGESLNADAMLGFQGSPNSRVLIPEGLNLPPACESLFALRNQGNAEQLELQKAARQLKLIKDEKKKYEELPLLDRLTDDRSISNFDTQIKIAENRVRKASQAAEVTKDRILAQEKLLNQAEHDAELDAIGFDPELIKAADLERSREAVEAYREYRLHEKQRAAVIAEYQAGLDDFDKQIAGAPDESTRLGLQEQKDRYQRAFDGWTDQSKIITSGKYRELARQFEQNEQDGLGPKSFGELAERVERTGSRPEDVLENYLADDVERAARIARSDKVTLGGSATAANNAASFIKDTALAYAEEYEKATLGPGELIEKLARVADGEEDVFADEAQFWNRFGRFAKGAAKGGVNGVIDTAGLLHDGLTLGLENQEARLEEALSFISGEDVQIDYFGDRKTKAFDRAVDSAGDLLHSALSADGLNPIKNLPTAAELWANPLAMGDYVVDRAQAFSKTVAAGTDSVIDAADRKLADTTRGGEKALGDTLETAGEFVGEASDLGTGFIAFGEAARMARQVSRVGDVGDDAADLTRMARAGSEIDVTGDVAAATRSTILDGPPPPASRVVDEVADLPASTLIEPPPSGANGTASSLPSAENAEAASVGSGVDLAGGSDVLPSSDFASPMRPSPGSDPRMTDTIITPAEAKLNRDLGVRYDEQLFPAFSSETQRSAGTIVGNVEPGTLQLPSQAEIVLNDGQKYVLGEKLGRGGSKQVYSVPSNPNVVDKAVSYPANLFDANNPRSVADIDDVIYDNEVGRTLLQRVEHETGGQLFSVTQRHGKPILVDDPFNPNNKFLITREDNITSPVERVRPDGSVETVMVTNAQERFALRPDKASTEAERLTMQLTLRELNDRGLVWTDQKLGNFDIVPDELSPTGHRMVLFDHDGVRVAQGAGVAERAENARRSQQIFDSLDHTVPNDYAKRMYASGLTGTFNDGVFGKPMPILSTPGINLKRTDFLAMNDLSPDAFGALLADFEKRTGRTIPYTIARP